MLAFLILAAMNTPVDDLAQKVIRAYGDWTNVASFRQTGRVIPAMRAGEGKLTREWRRSDKLRVEIAYPDHTEIRDVDGDRGTQNGKAATGMGLDAMRLQAARLALPILLEAKKSSLRGKGPNSIELPLDSGMSLTIEVDPASGHILKSIGKAEGIEFSTTYRDFRTVDGLLFAFREENTAQGMPTGTNEITSVDVKLRK